MKINFKTLIVYMIYICNKYYTSFFSMPSMTLGYKFPITSPAINIIPTINSGPLGRIKEDYIIHTIIYEILN